MNQTRWEDYTCPESQKISVDDAKRVNSMLEAILKEMSEYNIKPIFQHKDLNDFMQKLTDMLYDIKHTFKINAFVDREGYLTLTTNPYNDVGSACQYTPERIADLNREDIFESSADFITNIDELEKLDEHDNTTK